jgi:hypothetical protein
MISTLREELQTKSEELQTAKELAGQTQTALAQLQTARQELGAAKGDCEAKKSEVEELGRQLRLLQTENSENKRLLAVREGGTQERLKAVQEENMVLKQQVCVCV